MGKKGERKCYDLSPFQNGKGSIRKHGNSKSADFMKNKKNKNKNSKKGAMRGGSGSGRGRNKRKSMLHEDLEDIEFLLRW